MNCFTHETKNAVGICKQCNKGLCHECVKIVNEIYLCCHNYICEKKL
jgi:hypothetical protein